MGVYGSPEILHQPNAPVWDKNLVVCKKCGSKYSKYFKKCPRCGASKPHSCLYYLVWIFGGLFVVFFLLSLSGIAELDNTIPVSVFQQENQQISKEEFIASCENVAYEDIARNPDKQTGKNTIFTGEVIQVIEGNGLTVAFRVNTSTNKYLGYIGDTIYIDYTRKSNSEDRILEGDIITIYGVVKGTKSYITVLGNQVTIPYLVAEYIDICS